MYSIARGATRSISNVIATCKPCNSTTIRAYSLSDVQKGGGADMLAFSVYGGVETQRTQVRITWIHQVVLTSSNTWAAPVISARYHAASRLWAGSNLNRLRQG